MTENINKAPDKCPYCGSDEITIYDIAVVPNALIGEANCYECGGEWEEVYTYSHIVLDPKKEVHNGKES
jgi:hypothetical protein